MATLPARGNRLSRLGCMAFHQSFVFWQFASGEGGCDAYSNSGGVDSIHTHTCCVKGCGTSTCCPRPCHFGRSAAVKQYTKPSVYSVSAGLISLIHGILPVALNCRCSDGLPCCCQAHRQPPCMKDCCSLGFLSLGQGGSSSQYWLRHSASHTMSV